MEKQRLMLAIIAAIAIVGGGSFWFFRGGEIPFFSSPQEPQEAALAPLSSRRSVGDGLGAEALNKVNNPLVNA